MVNHQATPSGPVGLSVGATTLALTRDGHAAVIRPSEVTLHGRRLAGFVDRVGDPVPVIAPDGTPHRPEHLLAEALLALARAAGYGSTDMAVAVPAHWRPSVVDTLRRTMPDEVPMVSDATAALTTLDADPGLPSRGVVVLCDFGGSGTSITLANASANHAVVGETLRLPDFSGDLVDQALLTHVMSSVPCDADPSGTAVVGSLARLRDECRAAKERLSAETATAVAVDLPGHRGDIRVTRSELERLAAHPVADLLAALDEMLERYGVPPAAVTAVATVGGGARIPLITQKLSEHLRAPVVTTAQPQLAAATGAALIGQRRRVVEIATALFDAGPPSRTSVALAWSQDDDRDDAPVHSGGHRPEIHFEHEEWQQEAASRRSPLVLFGLAAAAAVITAAVFGVMQLRGHTDTPVDAATTLTPEVSPSPAPAAPARIPAPSAPQATQPTTIVVHPAQRSSAPQRQSPRQAPAAQAAPAPATAPPPTPVTTTAAATPSTTPSAMPPTTSSTPPTTPPEAPPSPDPPPIDPGPGNGEPAGSDSSVDQTGTDTVPVDPGPGGGD
ncbi:Hsp70 family protein [Mycolicibacterium sp. ND9-15]|uniref:Hsp70 family protein n=1 Tax=Mycolicibacterium sp. ND9-15 TaxID=3042320 RepID=UPI002DD82AC9|nr:Hsp70 family protein [Mycolicibacterium sp. ND9-15]WSE58101.1 Hsp70 family protein [Mycolicibacterium sp. ND9-15]